MNKKIKMKQNRINKNKINKNKIINNDVYNLYYFNFILDFKNYNKYFLCSEKFKNKNNY